MIAVALISLSSQDSTAVAAVSVRHSGDGDNMTTIALITDAISRWKIKIQKKSKQILVMDMKIRIKIEKKWLTPTEMDYKKDAIYSYWVQYTTKVFSNCIYKYVRTTQNELLCSIFGCCVHINRVNGQKLNLVDQSANFRLRLDKS